MNFTDKTVLVTGGATGIGWALVQRLHARGARVAICGRRPDRLSAVAAEFPGILTRSCDVASPAERADLAAWAVEALGGLDVLINNAGIQNRIRLAAGPAWEAHAEEIAINLGAPVHLTGLLLPQLLTRPEAMVMQVTSGLAFVPGAFAPVYCATKAALHSYTMSLRQQLLGSTVRVVELAPPAVNTDLGGAGLHTFGVPLTEFADAVFPRIEAGEEELGYGFSEAGRLAVRGVVQPMFERLNAPRS
jgi:uncharacterized oxidoreductase